MVFALCTSSNIDWYLEMTFREDSLNGLQVIERTRFCDRQTERRPRENNIFLYPEVCVGGWGGRKRL